MATLTIEINAAFADAPALPINLETGAIEIGTLPSPVARDTASLNTASGTWPQAIPLGSVAAPGLCVLKHCTGGSDIEIGYTRDGSEWSAAYARTLDFTGLSVTDGDVVDVYIDGDKVATYTTGVGEDLANHVISSLTSQLNALPNCSAKRDGYVVTLVGVGTLDIEVQKNASEWTDVVVPGPIVEQADEWVCLQTLKPGQTLVLNLKDFPATPQWEPQSIGVNLVSYLLTSATA